MWLEPKNRKARKAFICSRVRPLPMGLQFDEYYGNGLIDRILDYANLIHQTPEPFSFKAGNISM